MRLKFAPNLLLGLALAVSASRSETYSLPLEVGTSNQSTGNPSGCPAGTQYFKQLVNHPLEAPTTSYDRSVFLQQYQLISDHFKAGGPILIFQGAENDMITCLETLAMYQYAQELGGIAASLEHRYFGLSAPLGLNYSDNLNWPTEDLSALTLDNVQLDAVTFARWIKQSVPGAQRSKVFVFGGSYGGWLSAMHRIRHPETFDGAIASSGPFKGFVTSPTDPKIFELGDWLGRVYAAKSAEAASKIRSSFQELTRRMESGAFHGLDQELNLCYPPNTTDQLFQLKDYLLSSFNAPAQYNYGMPHGAFPSFPLDAAISAILQANNSMAVLKDVATLGYNSTNKAPCADWNTIQRGHNFAIPFFWMQCKYFPYVNNVWTRNDSIFGCHQPPSDNENMNEPWCKNSFSTNAISAEGIQEKLNFTQQTLVETQHLIFFEGLADPASAAGPEPFYPTSSNPDKSVMLSVPDAGHAAEEVMALPADSEALTAARNTEFQYLKEWL